MELEVELELGKIRNERRRNLNILQQLKLFLKVVVLIHILHHSLLLTENMSHQKMFLCFFVAFCLT